MEDKIIYFDKGTPKIEQANKVSSLLAVNGDDGTIGAVHFDLLVLEAGKNVGDAVKIESLVLPTLGTVNKKATVRGGQIGRNFTYTDPVTAITKNLPVGINMVADIFWDGILKTWSIVNEDPLPQVEGTDHINPDGNAIPTEKAVAKYATTNDMDVAIKVLNLNTDSIRIESIVPEDKTSFVFNQNQTTSGIYFENVNHKGFKTFYVKSYVTGDATIRVFTRTANVLNILHTKTVSLVVGINSFTAQQLEIPSSVLSQTVFYIGITPSSLGQTRFLNDTDGKLSVGSISNFTVTDTIHNGCTWFIVETSQNFVLSDFPKSKTMLENTINMVAGNVTETVPENRNGLNLGVSGASSSVYGEEEIFVNSANKLGTLKIFAKGAGDAHVYFAEINNGIAIVKHTKLISCIAGLNVFTSDDLGVTNLIENASRNLYILCGNALDQPSNPIHGQGNYSKSRPWFTINRSTGNLIVSNNNQRFSFFIEREVSDNPLINEVKSLRETVDNGLDITKKWTGATGVSFGDSITWYDGKAFLTTHIESGTIAKGYQTYLREYFNCSIINSGQSGWDITQIVNVVTGFSSYSNIDFVTLTSGANDARKGIPLGAIAPIGSSFDASTYIGAMQKAIEHIILQNPATKIYLITPINGWFNESGTSNVPGPYNNEMFISRDYINALIEIGKIYAIPVCNWYDKSFINKVNWRTYIGDRVDIPYYLHPTNAGYKLMGEMLCKFLEDN